MFLETFLRPVLNESRYSICQEFCGVLRGWVGVKMKFFGNLFSSTCYVHSYICPLYCVFSYTLNANEMQCRNYSVVLRGGDKFFLQVGHKIEQVGPDLRKPKKRSLRQIGLLFCEFSVGPKKTIATILKLPQGKGSFGGGACWQVWGDEIFVWGGAAHFSPLVAALM